MTGYTPVFNSALDGTLFGKWPHTGVWLCLLSQCDWRGNIDVVPQLLAAKIGVPIETLLSCIKDFMEPDPGSRTGDLDGRRLELIDPKNRNWGWRVINHSIYREKARKSAYDAARVEDGRNKARMAARKENGQNTANSLDPRRPDETRDDPLSDSDSDSDSNTNPNSNSDTAIGEEGMQGEGNLGSRHVAKEAPLSRAIEQSRAEKIRLARIGLEGGMDEAAIYRQYGLTRAEVMAEPKPKRTPSHDQIRRRFQY